MAVDGAIVTASNSDQLGPSQCATPTSSTSVRAWLRIDLRDVYLITKVVVTFYGISGRKAMIRVGSSTSNDGNNNLLCGTVDDYGDGGTISTPRTVECKERLWGRYVNVQRAMQGLLRICEVEIYNG